MEAKDFIQSNIRFLRKSKGLTQEEFALQLGITRAQVGAYEEGRAKPAYETIIKMANFFSLSLDALITKNLETGDKTVQLMQGNGLRVLSISVTDEGRENIELVPVKAAAGYLNGFADPEYIEELSKFRLPFLPESTYRAFEIKGDSMYPLQPGSIVVGEYIENWKSIKDGHTYIVVSDKDGIVYKRLFNQLDESGTLVLHSDNPGYTPYTLKMEDIREVWKAILHISYANKGSENSFDQVIHMMQGLQKDIDSLRKSKKTIH